jgi:hypothetical protein
MDYVDLRTPIVPPENLKRPKRKPQIIGYPIQRSVDLMDFLKLPMNSLWNTLRLSDDGAQVNSTVRRNALQIPREVDR